MKNVTIDMGTTQRGFVRGKFTDEYGLQCSLQKSSAMRSEGDQCIWLGIDSPEDTASYCPRNGTGWHPIRLKPGSTITLPELCDINVPDRMHLNQEQVKALLPALQHFAETGELPI